MRTKASGAGRNVEALLAVDFFVSDLEDFVVFGEEDFLVVDFLAVEVASGLAESGVGLAKANLPLRPTEASMVRITGGR